MLLAGFIRRSTASLEKLYPSPEAKGMVLMLCEDKLGVKSYTHITQPDFEIPQEMEAELENDVRRMCKGEPLQYVTGHCEFYGRRFSVGPSVLIPRPETELLVQEAVTHALTLDRPMRMLDLCTGSGCIAWSVALEVPYSEVVAVDISEEALEVASSQFEENRPLFIKADVLDPGQTFDHGIFDIITGNPPYVMEGEKAEMRSNVLDYEPSLALFVPDDDPLVFYRAIAQWASRFLAPDGIGLVEINEALGAGTADVFRDARFRAGVLKDLSGRDRIVRFCR